MVAVVALTARAARGDDFAWPPAEHANTRAIKDKFAHASRDPLGTPEDVSAIKEAVLAAMNHPASQIREIRWITPETAMVETVLLETGGWIFVIEKQQKRWVIIRRYLTRIF